MHWDQKPYHSLSYELTRQFGKKVYKLSLDGGMTCPNRDGTLGDRGCIFCSQGGSGDFAAPRCQSLEEQIRTAKTRVQGKMPQDGPYIAYFQSYTNTYAPVSYLSPLFSSVLARPDIAVLDTATRPDCLSSDVVGLLAQLNRQKPVWVELGLQTIHPETARFIRRGYPLPVFEDALARLKREGLTVIVHVILGLPGETPSMMEATVSYLSRLPIDGIKLQLLHILKGTDLADLYQSDPFPLFTMEGYVDCVIRCLELLPPHVVIHRLTGDGPGNLLIAPQWSRRKRAVLNLLHQTMARRNTWQGRRASHVPGETGEIPASLTCTP